MIALRRETDRIGHEDFVQGIVEVSIFLIKKVTAKKKAGLLYYA